MKVYSFGAEHAPVILLLPGTCCHWKGNFGRVIPLLADSYRVLCISYDGFDETEHTEFPTILEETEKIETYIQEHSGGHIRAAYGCSLGGSFVGLLAARGNIHMDYGILGSSDLDQASPIAAKLQTNLLLPLIYPVIRGGRFKSRLLQKRLTQRKSEMGGYVQAFMEMLGGARPYVTVQSCKNQFYGRCALWGRRSRECRPCSAVSRIISAWNPSGPLGRQGFISIGRTFRYSPMQRSPAGTEKKKGI